MNALALLVVLALQASAVTRELSRLPESRVPRFEPSSLEPAALAAEFEGWSSRSLELAAAPSEPMLAGEAARSSLDELGALIHETIRVKGEFGGVLGSKPDELLGEISRRRMRVLRAATERYGEAGFHALTDPREERALEPAPSVAAKAFGLLPAALRRPLAARSERARPWQIAALRREIAELLPPEAVAVMAQLPQTSHDYLLDELPGPAAPRRGPVPLLAGAKEDEPWNAKYERQRERQRAWLRRLRSVEAKLVELGGLEELVPGAELEQAMTHLSLGLLYGFSYGFERAVHRGDPEGPPISLLQILLFGWPQQPEGERFVDKATAHLQSALAGLERDPIRNARAVLVARYLLGKHALNGVAYYSNSGYINLPPEPRAFEYLALAKSALGEALAELSPVTREGAAPWSGLHELYFETLYFLIHAVGWEQKLSPEVRRSFLEARERRLARAARFEGLLVDLLSAAPAAWVMEHVAMYHYGLVFRLVNDLRWSVYDDDRDRANALFEVEAGIRSRSIGYDGFLDGLARAGVRPRPGRQEKLTPP